MCMQLVWFKKTYGFLIIVHLLSGNVALCAVCIFMNIIITLP